MPETPNAALLASIDLQRSRHDAFECRIGRDALLTLQLRTAEMLGFPNEVCGIRACRRARCCRWTRDGIPACLDYLLADERTGFDEIFDYIVDVYALARGRYYSLQLVLLLQQLPDYLPAVVEIIHHALPPGDSGRACLQRALRDIDPVRRCPKRPMQPALPVRPALPGQPVRPASPGGDIAPPLLAPR
jgi:hypothetical protein